MTPISLFIARRYFSPKRKERSRAGNRFIIIGLAVGVMSLVATLGVMNGLQQGYISTILEVGSGHVDILSRGRLSETVIQQIKQMKGFKAITAETETQTMGRGLYRDYSNMLIKGFDFDLIADDQVFEQHLNLLKGHYPGQGEILLGAVLANNLGLSIGDDLYALAMPQGRLTAYEQPLTISGIFKTGYYDYDSNMAFISLEESLRGFALDKEIYYKIKLKNPYKDQQFLKELQVLNLEAVSWRTFNQAFFSALRVEKNVMFLLLSLIFIVVAVTIFQGRSRDIEEKSEEIAILRALGATAETVSTVFILQGVFVGVIGGLAGLLFGLIISYNITAIFAFIEQAVNQIILLLGFPFSVSLLSGDNFYLENGIPVKIYAGETLTVFLIALTASMLAAYLATRRLTGMKPWQALRND